MTKPDPITKIVHTTLLLLSAALITLRCHINESFPLSWKISGPLEGVVLSSGETPAMLINAGIIFTLTLIWFLNQCRCQTFTWRKTALIGPALLFLIAAAISTTAASNKHLAIIGVTNFIAALTLAILLIQLLDARWKIHLILAILTATGITQAYRCWEQKTYDAPLFTKNALKNFDETLRRQNIEPGTYAAYQFKERILSKDIGGLFAISNTAASLFILTIFATLALTSERKNFLWIFGFLLVAPQLYGLAITQSKGGILAFIAALILAGLLYVFRNVLKQHAQAAFKITLILIALATAAIIGHGLYHGRLPTNSMFVRWQYWQASASMIAEHPFTGVGAENFGLHYPRYMNPAAPEVIKDPHNLWIALLTQWGPLGLIAFLFAIIALTKNFITPQTQTSKNQNTFHPKLLQSILIAVPIISLTLLARFLTTTGLETTNALERNSVILITFIIPLIIWTLAFLFALTQKEKPDSENKPSPLTPIFLGAGLLGFLLHNSIDFAIFHPALTTTFFALAATTCASHQLQSHHTIDKNQTPIQRWIFAITTSALLTGFWTFTTQQCQAHNNLKSAQETAKKTPYYLTTAHQLADQAIASDHLNPAGYELQSKISQQLGQFQNAINQLAQASRRDPENFSYYHRTSQIFQTQDNLPKALQAAQQAYIRNPVKPEVAFNYATLLEKSNQPNRAISIYTRILQNEKAFINQQKQMYPHQKVQATRLTSTLKNQIQKIITPAATNGSGPEQLMPQQ